MWRRSIKGIRFGYMKVRINLPSGLRKTTDEILISEDFTDYQIQKIELLGKSLGMDKSEIIAATNIPIDNMGSVKRRKITLFGVLVSIIIVVCISFGLSLLMNGLNFFDPTPTFTYTPGTRYGSISPNDFIDGT